MIIHIVLQMLLLVHTRAYHGFGWVGEWANTVLASVQSFYTEIDETEVSQ